MNALRDRRWWLSLGATLALVVLFWGLSATVAGAPEPGGGSGPSLVPALPADVVNSRISYQGMYREAGIPYTGPRDMVFDLFTNNTCAGVALLSIPKPGVNVTSGLFAVALDVGQNYVYGEGLWLRVTVAGTPMGCSEIMATPYALSLRPGAQIIGAVSAPTNSIIKVEVDTDNPAAKGVWTTTTTGNALRAESQHGDPIVASTETGYAVAGYDTGTDQARGYAGYFYSLNGVGVYGQSDANRTANNAYAPGVYGKSAQGYGGYFYSQNAGALYASGAAGGWYAGYISNRGGNLSPGLYVNGTSFFNGAKTGYVVDIAMNGGPEALETGEVVVITEYAEPVAGEIPVVKVRRASQADSTAVMGVVDQPFAMQSQPEDEGKRVPVPMAAAARSASGTAVGAGQYVSVVTLGAYRAIKVDASNGAIHAGDLLVSSTNPGYAVRSDSPRLGAVIGKALGSLDKGTGVIPVLVTLQ